MSVYTDISVSELDGFLRRYSVGALRDYAGITDGIENTNYFVTTDAGRFVLTLFESTTAEALPYCLSLMAFLAERAVPCAHPVADREGRYLQDFKDKPAALVQRLNGVSVKQPDREHCRILGATIGRMHQIAQAYSGSRENERGAVWREATAALIRDQLGPEDRATLDTEIAFQRNFNSGILPHGVIHADLFRDNALFQGHALTGLIDLYYSHTGPLIYDLAVAVSDWCFGDAGRFDTTAARAMVQGYTLERPLGVVEREAWLACLRAAGLRFWLSRLKEQQFPRGGAITHIKDPEPFKAVIEACHSNPSQLASIW